LGKALSKKQIRARRIAISIVAVFALAAVVFFYLVMTESGHWLVDDDEFDHASWVAILDGQSADLERIDYAADLMAAGKVDSVVILGRRCLRNRNNAEFYADEFMRLGSFDSNAVFLAPHDDASTIGEAFTIIPWLKKHNADTVLLLTSAPATHRVKRIFEKLSGDSPVYLTVDIHHYQYDANSWYTSRESRKSWLREWAALAASYIDLWNSGILTEADSLYYKRIRNIRNYEDQKNPVVDLQSLIPKAKKSEATVKDSVETDSNEEPKESESKDNTETSED